MDTFAALSLATDYPTRGVLQRRPEPRGTAIITVAMWKMVLFQSIYQMIVIFILHYGGNAFFATGTEVEQRRLQTTAFNTYIYMQVFNQTNCRRADSGFNIFEGLLRNPWFFFVQIITITGQTLIVMFGGNAFQTARPTGPQWATSIVLGFLTLPFGALVRLFPNKWFLLMVTPVRRAFNFRMRKKREKKQKKELSNEKQSLLRRLISVVKREVTPPGPIIPTVDDAPPPTSEEMKLHRTASRTSLQRQNAQAEINLSVLLESARAQVSRSPYRFEVHPNTQKDDPVFLVDVEDFTIAKVPPSQDPAHLQYLGLD